MLLAKNENTCRIHKMLVDAIYLQNIESIEKGNCRDCIGYSSIESYDRTLFRLWDWSYKHCVSPEILERLRPYIQKVGAYNV